MQVRFVDFGKNYKRHEKEIDQAIKRVLSNGDLILREDIDEFERNLADFVGTKHAIALSNGTDAIYLALRAAGVKKGDEVITVSHTFVATIEAIERLGAQPVLIDVNSDYVMDVHLLEKAITPWTKAIVPVHLSGVMCDMSPIKKIAEDHALIIIEDACQALGASYQGRKAGSMGLAGCFSFYPAKIFGSMGDAGAVTTNDDEVADKIRKWRHHSYVGKDLGVENDVIEYGTNARMDNLQAAILNVKFKYLDDYLQRRKEIADKYNEGLSGLDIILPRDIVGRVWQDYVIRVDHADELAGYLKGCGVETLGVGLIPNHFYKGLDLDFSLPMTEAYTIQFIRLPCNPELTDNEIDYVIRCIQEYASL